MLAFVCGAASAQTDTGDEQPADEAASQASAGRTDSKADERELDGWMDRWVRFRAATREVRYIDFDEGLFRARIGFRFQVDGTTGTQNEALAMQAGEIDNTLDFRRLRLFADGDFLRRYHFRFEFDFAEDPGLKDAYVDGFLQPKLHVVTALLGNSREPFSLDRRTSSNYTGFLERSLPVGAFAPGHNPGAVLYGTPFHDRVTWAVGVFTSTNTVADNQSSSKFTLTGRATGLPVYKDHGRQLIHVGASLSLRNPSDGTVQYAARPEARFAPVYLDTGPLAADSNLLTGLEVAVVRGPFWGQAEWMQAAPTTNDFGRLRFAGSYAQVGWFASGEHRNYRVADGTWGRLNPERPVTWEEDPFRKKNHRGALEFVGRISTLDLSDGPVQGGEMTDLTLGANWYLTRGTRVMLNYIRSRVENGQGKANLFLFRYQFNPGYNWPLLKPKNHH
jgi:phosphate-selective porin OprO/OprP